MSPNEKSIPSTRFSTIYTEPYIKCTRSKIIIFHPSSPWMLHSHLYCVKGEVYPTLCVFLNLLNITLVSRKTFFYFNSYYYSDIIAIIFFKLWRQWLSKTFIVRFIVIWSMGCHDYVRSNNNSNTIEMTKSIQVHLLQTLRKKWSKF